MGTPLDCLVKGGQRSEEGRGGAEREWLEEEKKGRGEAEGKTWGRRKKEEEERRKEGRWGGGGSRGGGAGARRRGRTEEVGQFSKCTPTHIWTLTPLPPASSPPRHHDSALQEAT